MKKTITLSLLIGAAAIALLAMTRLAPAQTIIHENCTRGGCTTIIGRMTGTGIAKIIHVPPSLDPDQERRIAKWVAFCEPRTEKRPPYYVSYYVYKHEGCEYGRDE